MADQHAYIGSGDTVCRTLLQATVPDLREKFSCACHQLTGRQLTMKGRKHKALKAAHARTFRWPQKPPVPSSEAVGEDIPSSPDVEYLTHAQLDLNLQSESALPSNSSEYTGGVNYHSDTNWPHGAVSVCSDSDLNSDESLCELEGNELDSNLAALQLIEAERIKSEWFRVFKPKEAMEWKAAEKNRALGYNGHSDQTCRWREKEAHDRAIS